MKQILTIIAVLFALTVNAQQQRRFSIDPYVQETFVTTPDTTYTERVDTATQAALYISGIGKTSSTLQYALYKSDSVTVIKYGITTISNTAAGVLLVSPINLTNLNNLIMGQLNLEALAEY